MLLRLIFPFLDMSLDIADVTFEAAARTVQHGRWVITFFITCVGLSTFAGIIDPTFRLHRHFRKSGDVDHVMFTPEHTSNLRVKRLDR